MNVNKVYTDYTESNLLFLVSVSMRTQIFLVFSKMRGNSTSDAESKTKHI